MNPLSVGDERFLKRLDEWLRGQAEILVLIRFSRAAGNKSFEFITSLEELSERVPKLGPQTCITAFRRPQLPIRGVVDEEFVRSCLIQIPDGSEFLVVETMPRTAGRASWYRREAGTSHLELQAALEDSFGVHVAVGQYPPWREDSPDVISGYVPDLAGNTMIGVY
jgi:hypothetical protein